MARIAPVVPPSMQASRLHDRPRLKEASGYHATRSTQLAQAGISVLATKLDAKRTEAVEAPVGPRLCPPAPVRRRYDLQRQRRRPAQLLSADAPRPRAREIT